MSTHRATAHICHVGQILLRRVTPARFVIVAMRQMEQHNPFAGGQILLLDAPIDRGDAHEITPRCSTNLTVSPARTARAKFAASSTVRRIVKSPFQPSRNVS